MYYVTDNDITEIKPSDNFESVLTESSALDVFKRRRINLIQNSFDSDSTTRFKSGERYFDATETDRTALIGSITAGVDTYYKSYSDTVETIGAWNLYTTQELTTILNDGRIKLISLIQKRDTLIFGIQNSKTKEEVLNYVW